MWQHGHRLFSCCAFLHSSQLATTWGVLLTRAVWQELEITIWSCLSNHPTLNSPCNWYLDAFGVSSLKIQSCPDHCETPWFGPPKQNGFPSDSYGFLLNMSTFELSILRSTWASESPVPPHASSFSHSFPMIFPERPACGWRPDLQRPAVQPSRTPCSNFAGPPAGDHDHGPGSSTKRRPHLWEKKTSTSTKHGGFYSRQIHKLTRFLATYTSSCVGSHKQILRWTKPWNVRQVNRITKSYMHKNVESSYAILKQAVTNHDVLLGKIEGPVSLSSLTYWL